MEKGIHDQNLLESAVHAMLVYLAINYIKIDYDDKKLEDVIINVADGSMDSDELANWLKIHTQ